MSKIARAASWLWDWFTRPRWSDLDQPYIKKAEYAWGRYITKSDEK